MCLRGDAVRLATDPRCKDCKYRMQVNICKEFLGKREYEQYYVCLLSICLYGDAKDNAKDKFDEYLDLIRL